MEKAISSADARRKFFQLLQKVRDGHRFIVTKHGKPIARLVPTERHLNVLAAARTALLFRLENQSVVNGERRTRSQVYDADL